MKWGKSNCGAMVSLSGGAFTSTWVLDRQSLRGSWRRPQQLLATSSLRARDPSNWNPLIGMRRCCAMSGASSSESSGPSPVFPRIGVRDPYQRLGISREASEEEIREARNYLLKQYGDHQKSKLAIESAYDKVILESLKQWRNFKPKKLKPRPVWLQKLYDRFDTPPAIVIAARAFAFLLLGVWSVFGSGADGPVLQVILSLAACIYFLRTRFKVLWKASAIGVGSFIFAWVLGSFVVPALPTFIFPGTWNIELMTSLISYIVLWASCTFLK